MKSLVLELQRESMNQASHLSDVLRKALVVATKLKINEFKIWIESEMKGYSGEVKVPSYRKVKGSLKAWNPCNGWIPVIMEDSGVFELISSREIGQPISEIESMCNEKDKKGTLQVPLPQDVLMKLFSHSQEFQLGIVPTLLIDRSQLVGILDAVRNEILNWSLELENQGILGDGMSFSDDEINKAGAVTYNIQSFKGVIGNVSSSNLQIGDYSTIHDALKDHGVPQSERNELENILDDIKSADQPQRKNLIKKGYEWLGRNAKTIGALSATIKNWFDMLN